MDCQHALKILSCPKRLIRAAVTWIEFSQLDSCLRAAGGGVHPRGTRPPACPDGLPLGGAAAGGACCGRAAAGASDAGEYIWSQRRRVTTTTDASALALLEERHITDNTVLATDRLMLLCVPVIMAHPCVDIPGYRTPSTIALNPAGSRSGRSRSRKSSRTRRRSNSCWPYSRFPLWP